jgi:hypothetical protein
MSTDWQSIRTLLRFNHMMLTRVIDGVPDAALDRPIVPGGNTPRWVLAHLAVGLDLALLSIGVPTKLPKAWLAQFGPGSSGGFGDIALPTREALLAMIADGVHAVDEALASPSSETLARFERPHKAPLLFGTGLETIGHATAHLCTTHFALHIGQLTLVRRLEGLPPVLVAP